MSDRGRLEKLKIKAYEKPDYSGQSIGEFSAYINPSEITLSYEMEYDSAQGSGTTGSRMNFKKMKPGDLSLTFFLDGTGANGDRIDVQQKIEQFQTITGYNGNIHRPNYLKLTWGTLSVKRCVLKSASIAYKLFKPDGVPLRAIITANFTDNSDDRTRQAISQDRSPDLTHLHLVKAGDTLPGLCQQIYGSADYYLEVARANQIDHFRRLIPGQKLIFPPLQK
jgi:Contractile injection system tube protein/LysM domain